jgi:hypothetical protein
VADLDGEVTWKSQQRTRFASGTMAPQMKKIDIAAIEAAQRG